MWVTRRAVGRPLAVLALYLAIAVAGIVAYRSLSDSLFPRVNTPIVTITTVFPGAGPDEVELQVTRVIEDAVRNLANTDTVTSVSGDGFSTVTVAFTERANEALIASEVERQVNAVVRSLPIDAERPTIVKADLNALPIIQLALVGSAPQQQLFTVADSQIRPRLERLRDVASVGVLGGRKSEIQVEVDPARLAAFGVTLPQVQLALAQNNTAIPAGSVTESGREASLRVFALAASADELNRIVVGGTPQQPVRLRDVATVRETLSRQTQVIRVNGEEAVVLRVIGVSGGSTTDIATAVRNQLPRLSAEIPAGSRLEVIQDNAVFVRDSLAGVQSELLAAVVLTSLVLLLFLHSVRAAIIVLLTIPVTLLMTFIGMIALGFSFNVMSTLGLTLTIGILVDDTVVIIENIIKRLRLGDDPAEAAINGRAEIGGASLAIALVDIVIFVPTGLVSGQIGAFFREFGFTIAAATISSLLVSFTLTPMLASKMLVYDPLSRNPLARFGRLWDKGFNQVERGYRFVLGVGLRFPAAVILLAVASIGVGVAILATGRVGNEFFPRNDQGSIAIATEMPPGTSLEAHDAVMRQIEARLATISEIATYTTQIGVGQVAAFTGGSVGQARLGSVTIELVPKATGRRDVFVVADEIRSLLAELPEVTTRVTVNGAGGAGAPIQVRLEGSDPAVLSRLAAQTEAALRGINGLRDVTNDTAVSLPERRVVIDRARAEDFGVTPQAVGQTVRLAYNGIVATRLREPDGDQVDVRLFLNERTRQSAASLADLPLVTPSGVPIRLGQVAAVQELQVPAQINRRNGERVVTVGAALEPDRVLGDVSPQVRQAIAALTPPPGYSVAIAGSAQQQQESLGQLFTALGASIILAYLVMVVLYNSFLYPFVILFSLPVAIFGVIVGLLAFGFTFNLFSQIGLVLLIGVAIKNGILLVDRINQNRARGMNRRAAILEAGPARMRPILMTSVSLVAGVLPTALQLGEGSELRAPLAAAVLGGGVSSTFLTLVLVPVMYLLLDGAADRIRRLFGLAPVKPKSIDSDDSDAVPPRSESSETADPTQRASALSAR